MSQHAFDRRDFLKTTAAGVSTSLALGSGHVLGQETSQDPPESLVKVLYETLNDKQKQAICFDWDHQAGDRGLLRTHVSNNWHITSPVINSEFFNAEQKHLVRKIFEGIIAPEWHARYDKQLQDDAGGFGNSQNIAIFGTPGSGKFEFVMTGRHMTLRCDGDSADHVAFGGPLFYGHAASDFNEPADHPGNVFWEQAVAANEVYAMLDGKQRKLAEVAKIPKESAVGFKGKDGNRPGIPVTELSGDQKEHVQKVLGKLLEMYRQSDQNEVKKSLEAQGGLDACNLAFYTDRDIGGDRVWDNWRLEGPSFVWYFRGSPHVHVWVNVASSPDVKTNAAG
jgi:hypothetical protein